MVHFLRGRSTSVNSGVKEGRNVAACSVIDYPYAPLVTEACSVFLVIHNNAQDVDEMVLNDPS